MQFGLIPVSGFSLEDIERFEKMLDSLDEEESRKLKRKFRKIFRKIVKEKFGDASPSKNWCKTYGVGYQNPTKAQMKNRRYLVHDEIYRLTQSRIKNA